MVKDLVASGAEVHLKDKKGDTALHIAAQLKEDGPEVIEYLLSVESDVNLANDIGQTALHIAVSVGQGENVEVLVSASALMNLKDEKGATALHEAAKMGEEGPLLIECLISAGSEVN
ncbi:ankyrin repeat domain-containing protein, partial [Aspergillus aculeatinus CBS 121060]